MRSEDDEIGELYETAARARYQFIRVELQTCLTALEMADFELSIGNSAVAEREVACAEKGIGTARRFLPEVSAEQRTELEAKLAELHAILDAVKARLSALSR